jgi:hypothetical protein
MAEFLASFNPLCVNGRGRTAIDTFGLPPFIDASCRREPDLESAFPSVSAICRAGAFAPRLRVQDRIAYITTKRPWLDAPLSHWRLVAFLEVIDVLASHEAGAAWYESRGLELPSNCLARGNQPEPIERTAFLVPAAIRALATRNQDAAFRSWNAGYLKRAREIPTFIVCRAARLDVLTPRMVSEQDLVAAFGRVPATQTPPRFDAGEVSRLVNAVW